MTRSCVGVALFGLVLAAVPAAAAELADVSPDYTFIKIDYPGSTDGVPIGINAKRQVVGYYTDKKHVDHGYLWENGKFTMAIDYPGAAQTLPAGINDRGDVSGLWFDQQGFQHGFVLAPPAICADKGPIQCTPVFTSIDEPEAVQSSHVQFEFGPGLGTLTVGINNHDSIAGMYCTPKLYSNGFVYSHGVYRSVDNPYASHSTGNGTKLFAINDHDVIAGNYLERDPAPLYQSTHAFLLERGYYTSLDIPNSTKGGFGTQVNGVNNAKVAVGVYTTAKGLYRGFIWQKGQFSMLSFPGEPYTEINGVNSRGDLTGDYGVAPNPDHILGYLAFRKTK